MFQLLCREISQSGPADHLYEIVLNVTRAVALEHQSRTEQPEMNEKKQIPVMLATLMRRVYLKMDLDDKIKNNKVHEIDPAQRFVS